MKLSALLVLTIVGCTQSTTTGSVQPLRGDGLTGNWLLFERGDIAPADGIIPTSIASSPKQLLTLTADGKVSVQGDQLASWSAYKTYRVETTEPVLGFTTRLVLLPEQPNDNAPGNYITIKSDTFRISQPGRSTTYLAFIRVK